MRPEPLEIEREQRRIDETGAAEREFRRAQVALMLSPQTQNLWSQRISDMEAPRNKAFESFESCRESSWSGNRFWSIA